MHCSVPFKRLHVDVQGNVNLCFGTSWTSKGVGNVLQTNLWEIWKGEQAADFRDSILDQSFRYCTNCRCPELLDDGEISKTTSIDVIDCMVLAYDNTCNLSCPSCRREVNKPSPLADLIHQKVLQSGIFKKTKSISLFGSGEPLVSPLFWDLIAKLNSLDCHSDLSLILTTNALMLTQECLATIQASGKPVSGIEISVDAATEKTYSLNRRGGKWKNLLSNLDHLATSGIPIRFNFVVQANNYHEMPAFVELALRHNARYIRFDAVNNWGAYTTDDYKQRAIHFPGHPQHEQFKEILREPILKHERVYLAQLSDAFLSTLSPLQTILKLKGLQAQGDLSRKTS